jgi:hypothetical protein
MVGWLDGLDKCLTERIACLRYVLMGNKNSGALKLKLHSKKDANGFIMCGPPFCRNDDP